MVKAHRTHLGTSELVGKAIQNAAMATDMPDGIFSVLYGDSYACGEALVRHPAIRAVGFTGSRRGGLALAQVAQARLDPIPVYAEMSSINPIFLLPNALALRVETIAKDFVASLAVGAGQFCTNPGVMIAIEGEALDVFCTHAGAALGASAAATMLTPDIHQAYCRRVKQLSELLGVNLSPMASRHRADLRLTRRCSVQAPSISWQSRKCTKKCLAQRLSSSVVGTQIKCD